jgi:hypothetical protein
MAGYRFITEIKAMSSLADPLTVQKFYQERADRLEEHYNRRLDELQAFYDAKSAAGIEDVRKALKEELDRYSRLGTATTVLISLMSVFALFMGYHEIRNYLGNEVAQQVDKHVIDISLKANADLDKRVGQIVSHTDLYIKKNQSYLLQSDTTGHYLNVFRGGLSNDAAVNVTVGKNQSWTIIDK